MDFREWVEREWGGCPAKGRLYVSELRDMFGKAPYGDLSLILAVLTKRIDELERGLTRVEASRKEEGE